MFYTGTYEDVQAYLDAINNHEKLPINKPNGYVMLKWAENITECINGLYAVPKPSDALLFHHGMTQEVIDAFRAIYVTGKLTAVETIDPVVIEEE